MKNLFQVILIKSGGDNVEYGLFDEFDLDVVVWIPSREDNKIQGTLKYSHSEIFLMLEGDLFNIRRSVDLESLSVPVLYGEAIEGEKINLREGYISSYDLLGRKATISFRVLEVGNHYIESETEYVSVVFKPIGYRDWIYEDYFTLNHLYDLETKSIINESYNIFAYKFEGKNVKSVVSLSKQIEKGALEVKSFISIDYKNPRNFDDILNDVYLFNDLLMIFQNRFVPIENLSATDKFGIETKLYIIQRNDVGRSYHPKKMLIRYLKIENEFEQILKKWFVESKKFNMLKSLYLAHFYFDSVMDVRFMNSVQALEYYCREFIDTKIIKPPQFTYEIEEVLKFVDGPKFSGDFKEILKGKLEHINSVYLKDKIKWMLKELDDTTLDELFVNEKERNFAVTQMVNTRNYFAHYDENIKHALKGLDELYDAYIRVRAIILILILKDLGIIENEILKVIIQNEIFSKSIKDIKDFNLSLLY